MGRAAFSLMVLFLGMLSQGQAAVTRDGLVSWWRFDDEVTHSVADTVAGCSDRISGHFRSVDGVSGKCIRMDGSTTEIVRQSDKVPPLTDALTLQAWVAPQTYPWNWTPILNQGGDLIPPVMEPPAKVDLAHLKPGLVGVVFGEPDLSDAPRNEVIPPPPRRKPRLFFGLNASGCLALKLEIDGRLRECLSSQPLPLLKWSHVAGTFDGRRGLALFINGKPAGTLPVTGRLTPAEGGDLILGKNLEKMGPVNSERKASANWPSDMVFDGLLDEVKIFDRALSPDQIAQAWRSTRPAQPQPLQWLEMPSGPRELPPRFAAVYCRLNYDPLWEQPWRVSDKADILVHFDQSPVRVLFWRGTSYGAAWVSENGRWMGDQSLERVGRGKSPRGCAEHMSDKQTRYSHVSIIAQSDARIVVHWRYALCDIAYEIFAASSPEAWGEWADEFYVFYPDAVSTRHQTLWTDHLSHEWQETIVLNQPGTRPEDNLELDAMTLANMNGQSHTYSWAEQPPAAFSEPADITIQRVNLKSRFKPFIIFEPGPRIKPFTGAIHREYSHFPCWNHWPVAQLPNDGRVALAPDRPSHSSLSQSIEDSSVIHTNTGRSFSVVTLVCMSDQPVERLASLARSWNHPPRLSLASSSFAGGEYDRSQRAFLLDTRPAGKPKTLTFTLAASEAAPLVNPAFVIRNWGECNAQVLAGDQPLLPGKNLRIGHEHRLEGSDLVVWLKTETAAPLTLSIKPVPPGETPSTPGSQPTRK